MATNCGQIVWISFTILSDLSVDVVGAEIVIIIVRTLVGRDRGLNNSTKVKDPFVQSR